MRYRLGSTLGPETFDPVSGVDPAGVVDARGLIQQAMSLFSPNSGSTGAGFPRGSPDQPAQPTSASSGLPLVPIALVLGAYLFLKRKRR